MGKGRVYSFMNSCDCFLRVIIVASAATETLANHDYGFFVFSRFPGLGRSWEYETMKSSNFSAVE